MFRVFIGLQPIIVISGAPVWLCVNQMSTSAVARATQVQVCPAVPEFRPHNAHCHSLHRVRCVSSEGVGSIIVKAQ